MKSCHGVIIDENSWYDNGGCGETSLPPWVWTSSGDRIVVTSLPFAESPFGELEDVVGVERPSWWPWLVYLLIGGAVLAAGIQLYRQRQRRQEEEYRAVQEQAAVAQLEEEPEEVVQRQQVQEQVERLVRQQPETVAQLLSTWMPED